MNLQSVKKELKSIKRTSFGISIPELRKFAKKLAKSDYKMFLKENTFETFELKLLHAFLIGYINADINVLLKYFEDFMPFVDDWAVNDSLCQNFKIARKYPEIVWNFLIKYKSSKKEFENRIVSVMLLSHFLNDDYIDRVFDILKDLNTDNYYSQMGLAWLIATIMGKYPDKGIKYLQSPLCSLNENTLKKTLQKIRESYRVSNEVKNFLFNKSTAIIHCI